MLIGLELIKFFHKEIKDNPKQPIQLMHLEHMLPFSNLNILRALLILDL